MVSEARRRFLSEGYAANAVKHPGVVSVLDDDVSEDGSAFLVMELLEGETLEARASRSGCLPPSEVLPIAASLLEILGAAHAVGVVHRDIKPENVFLTLQGETKILDFGIARVRELSAGNGRTQDGSAMGTPAFMPPEQARGRWDEVDHRTDLWAVGATMFTLLAGRPVHDGATVNEVLLSAMTNAAPLLSTVCPGVSASVAEAVDRALAFDKSDRWPDAATMLGAVRHAARDSGVERFLQPASIPWAPPPLGTAILGAVALALRVGEVEALAPPRRRSRGGRIRCRWGADSAAWRRLSAGRASRRCPCPDGDGGPRDTPKCDCRGPRPLPSQRSRSMEADAGAGALTACPPCYGAPVSPHTHQTGGTRPRQRLAGQAALTRAPNYVGPMSTSRSFAPFAGPTSPRRSIVSTMRAARLYPSCNLR